MSQAVSTDSDACRAKAISENPGRPFILVLTSTIRSIAAQSQASNQPLKRISRGDVQNAKVQNGISDRQPSGIFWRTLQCEIAATWISVSKHEEWLEMGVEEFKIFKFCVCNHKAEFSGPLWAVPGEASPEYRALYLGCCFEVIFSKRRGTRMPCFPLMQSWWGVKLTQPLPRAAWQSLPTGRGQTAFDLSSPKNFIWQVHHRHKMTHLQG